MSHNPLLGIVSFDWVSGTKKEAIEECIDSLTNDDVKKQRGGGGR